MDDERGAANLLNAFWGRLAGLFSLLIEFLLASEQVGHAARICFPSCHDE